MVVCGSPIHYLGSYPTVKTQCRFFAYRSPITESRCCYLNVRCPTRGCATSPIGTFLEENLYK